MQEVAATTYTAEDLLTLPDGGERYELVAGDLRKMTPAGGPHGAITGSLFIALGQYVEAQRLGQLFTESTGFILRRDPDTVRCPDVAFVREDQLPAEGLAPGFLPVAPDLAVEVVSPSDTVYEVSQKVDEYLGAGVRSVWVVNPGNRTVTVYEPGGAARVLGEGDELDGGELVPGFRYPVARLFVRLRRRAAGGR
jgi:Uma2 family endonuclease